MNQSFALKYGLALACLFLLAPALSGQQAPRSVPEYSFTRFGENRMVFAGDSSAFEAFFCKMDSLSAGVRCNLRILHLGDSHVQGGTMTRQIRNDFFGMFPEMDGGRGLVFPFQAAKTNTPSSFKVRREGEWVASKNIQKVPSSRLGLTGMAVSTSDPKAAIRLLLVPRDTLPGDRQYSFDRVRILGYQAAGGRRPVLVLPCGDTLVASGVDSCWTFPLPERFDSLRIATKGEGTFTITGIFLDREEAGLSVSEVGVNGASLPSFSKCVDLERDLALVDPDMVILALGTNDAIGSGFSEEVFKARYKALVGRIRSVRPDCALVFVTNYDNCRKTRNGYVVNPNGPLAEHAFRELAQECGGALWDAFEIMGGSGSMKKWTEANLARRDRIHFTDEGYVILGDLFFNALIEKYREHVGRQVVE
jgi:Lysophospholipase L1 and related esterases